MSASRRTSRTSDRGASLIEFILVSVLLGIFFGGVYETVIAGLRVADAVDERANIRQQLTHALDLLTREASLAGDVDNAEDQRLQVDADIDGDGDDEDNINYRLTNGDLERVYSGTAVTLLRDLTSLDFDYVDLNGAMMTAPVTGGSRDDIRVVRISVTATRDNETISLASAAYLRNNR